MDKQTEKVKQDLEKIKNVKSLPEEIKKSIDKKQQYVNKPFVK